MDRVQLIELAERILIGETPPKDTLFRLASLPDERAFDLFAGASLIREHFFGRGIHLCTICNAKSGRCSEDCAFCSQSAFARTDAPVYPLLSKVGLQEGARAAQRQPINRFAWVTSGKRLPRQEVEALAAAISELNGNGNGYCASLGTLGVDDLAILKSAGLSRYHHNLEASRSFYGRICTTHSYDERVATVRAAKSLGLSVCAGGIFGLGETDQQILELAIEIQDLDVNAVPINFLTPIQGTRLASQKALTPLRCLKIISLFRYVLPDKDLLICGGREHNLKEIHALVFHAGASGIMTGNYLTTTGRTLEKDLELLQSLGLHPR
jgi:biotin synthase